MDDRAPDTAPAVAEPMPAAEAPAPEPAAPARSARKPRAVKAAAPAERKAASDIIKGARVVSIERDGSGVSYPALVFKGDAPRKGSTLRVKFDGVTYEGKAHDVIEADGELLVETDGLTPLDAPSAE